MVLQKIFDGYEWLFDLRDPRSDGLPLMSSPMVPIFMGIFYLLLVKKILPEFMKKRQPFELYSLLIFYNFVQVITNSYITFNALVQIVYHLSWYCSPIDFSETPNNRLVYRLIYLYFMTKILDLFDTIFFILRGKPNQASFLHVYHHWGMIALGWIGVKFLGGGHSIYFGFANAFVHTIMYFYYLVTSFKPEYRKSIWWKKHITQLQLAQFIFFVITYGRLCFVQDCTYPKFASYAILPQCFLMLALFGDFYYKAYMKPKQN